eukprot:Stramenopile-MAST_4_protein_4090
MCPAPASSGVQNLPSTVRCHRNTMPSCLGCRLEDRTGGHVRRSWRFLTASGRTCLLVLILTIVIVHGSCPNDCSGHGDCDLFGACDCNRYWSAPDCSQRLCPFGKAITGSGYQDWNRDGDQSDFTDLGDANIHKVERLKSCAPRLFSAAENDDCIRYNHDVYGAPGTPCFQHCQEKHDLGNNPCSSKDIQTCEIGTITLLSAFPNLNVAPFPDGFKTRRDHPNEQMLYEKTCCRLVTAEESVSGNTLKVDWLHRDVGWWEDYPHDGGAAVAGGRANSVLFEAVDDYENHFLSECSNAGDCDRLTGACICHSGFYGSNCGHATCIERDGLICSGHGECLSSAEIDARTNNFLQSSSFLSQSRVGCYCEPGYGGADCSERACPVGDDPETWGQQNEIQVLHIDDNDNPIQGTFYLKYTDYNGEVFETIDINATHEVNVKTIASSQVSVTFTVYDDLSPHSWENVRTNYRTPCGGDFEVVFPCLKVGDKLKLGTTVKTISSFSTDGLSFNVTGDYGLGASSSIISQGHKFFDRSGDIQYALLNLPNDAIMNISVARSSVTTFGVQYEVEFVANTGDLPLLQIIPATIEQSIFFKPKRPVSMLSDGYKQASTFSVWEKEKSDISSFTGTVSAEAPGYISVSADWASRVETGDLIELEESSETISQLGRVSHGVHGVPRRQYTVTMSNNGYSNTDEVQVISLRDYKAQQKLMSNGAFYFLPEIQRIKLVEHRTTQTIDIEPSAGSFADVDEIQAITISEPRARQIVHVQDSGFGNVDEVQTLTISEPRAKQVVEVANNAFANVIEVQTLTISEPRAKQVVEVANNAFANVIEVQTLTISEGFQKQLLLVAAGSLLSQGSYIINHSGQSSACVDYNTSAVDMQAILESLSTIKSAAVSLTTAGNNYTYAISISNPSAPNPIIVSSVGTGACTQFLCGGAACTDHTVTVSHTGGLGSFAGSQTFTLGFDTSTETDCPLCATLSSNTTGNIDWSESDMTATNS